MRAEDSQPLQDEAKTYMHRSDWAGAIPFLLRDIVEHPDDPWSRMYLGDCYSALENLNLALEQYRIAEDLAPADPTPVGAQGDLYCHIGDWERAGEFYRRAIEMSPNNPLAQKNWRWWNLQMTKT